MYHIVSCQIHKYSNLYLIREWVQCQPRHLNRNLNLLLCSCLIGFHPPVSINTWFVPLSECCICPGPETCDPVSLLCRTGLLVSLEVKIFLRCCCKIFLLCCFKIFLLSCRKIFLLYCCKIFLRSRVLLNDFPTNFLYGCWFLGRFLFGLTLLTWLLRKGPTLKYFYHEKNFALNFLNISGCMKVTWELTYYDALWHN